MEFEYDIEKSKANKQKHGIDFEEAQQLWNDESVFVVDLDFTAEKRYAYIGIINKKFWTAIITCRKDIVRIISVRRSRNEEVMLYEHE